MTMNNQAGEQMDSRKIVFRETAVILIGEALCVTVMLLICWLLNWFSIQVLLGGIIGGLLAVLNFFFMAVGTSLAADKAESQDVTGGKKLLQMSMTLRYVLLFVLLIAFTRSGLCHPVAMVLPVFFVRPIISFGEFFRKKGDNKQ